MSWGEWEGRTLGELRAEQVRANPEAAYDHAGVGINPLAIATELQQE